MCAILTKESNEREIKEFLGYLRNNRTKENPQSARYPKRNRTKEKPQNAKYRNTTIARKSARDNNRIVGLKSML